MKIECFWIPQYKDDWEFVFLSLFHFSERWGFVLFGLVIEFYKGDNCE